MTNSEESIQDTAHVFMDSHSVGEASTFFDFVTDEIAEIKFRNELRGLVERAIYLKEKHSCETDQDSMIFLGTYLGIDDYESNLFSSWILRTIMEQIVLFFNNISECNYKTFICWLYQEINILCYNPDVSRQQFFEFLNKIFHQALTEIFNGKGLLPLTNFIHHETTMGGMELKLGKITSNTGCNWVRSSSYIEGEVDYGEMSNTSFESNFKYHECSLHAIIEASYKIFGDEVDYLLIKSAFESQSRVLHYKLPYHCRVPKIVKKPVASEKPSLTSNFKLDKSLKKRKSLKKESVEIPPDISILSIDSMTVLNKKCSYGPEFILPLSETIEAYDAINNDENEEIETEE